MNDLLKFVDLLVKQTCRRAAYDFQMGAKHNEDKSSIYSLDSLKKMHEKPRENIYKLVKNPSKTLKGVRVGNGFNMLKKDNKFTRIEQKMLLDFVNKIKKKEPPRQLQWIDLQHYLHYVYRNFASSLPDPSTEVLSTFFIYEMKELVDSLKEEDESQLWLRVFALLREYCIFAQWHFSKNDQDHTLLRFFCYYEAMLTAAKNLVMVFSDFESQVIYKNYRVCWIDFNTFIFIRFFYESQRVKNRVTECIKLRKSPGDAPQMIDLLEDLKKLWGREQTRVSLVHQEMKIPESSPKFAQEKKNIAAHKKILAANFWVDRDKEEKDNIDLSRMDHNLFDLLKDRTFFPEGPGLNKNGQCICEECLIAKYKCFLDNESGQDFRVIRNIDRVTFCRKCKNLVDLDYFHRHINSHAVSDLEDSSSLLTDRATNLTRIISEKMDFVKLGNSSTDLTDLLNEKLKISDTPQSGILDTKKSKENFTKNQSSNSHNGKNSEMENTKLAFEEFLKHKRESPNKTEQLLDKNVRNFIKIKKDIFSNTNGSIDGKIHDGLVHQTSTNSTSSKNDKIGEAEAKMREIRRNVHKPYSTHRNMHSKCPDVCQGHGEDSCDAAEPKKCDCTYCEVFGTVHKNAELRDRLRVRLHQRREKRSKDHHKPVANSNTNNLKINTNNVKIKSVISKVETRVPLPSSPTNIPSTPSSSSESSINNMDFADDIHGLVNYIEGNTALNKIELAQKKSAKKARQRARREQERIQAEEEAKRKAEEMKRKEEERKREMERKLEEKMRLEAAAKKRYKKNKQQARKAAEAKFVEETIPAMVTIKRVADNENATPSVTITLKGYTPDQDKLLFTLVDEPSNKETEKIPPNNYDALCHTKKKKRKKSYKPPKETPKVVSKEVKVTLAVDKNPPCVKPYPETWNLIEKQQNGKLVDKKLKSKDIKKLQTGQEEEITSLGNLRLPPGITITKVEGPAPNRSYVGAEPPKGTIVGKSGVIVVDTEKLIHKSPDTNLNSPAKLCKNKHSKKNKNKKSTEIDHEINIQSEKPKMITLKNPIFQQYQTNKPIDNIDSCAPASIFTSENGMVTIRSSRLQQSLNNGNPSNSMQIPMPMPLIPNIIPDIPNKVLSNPNTYFPSNGCESEKKKEKECVSPLNAQEILSGLPGIEITKVDKKITKSDLQDESISHNAEVSIIPSSASVDFDFDKDDWLYDSVFKPRDVLEDDMDAEELELEAFKRFCQQSVPPKRKEKVAHLNVADIVLKKKTDVKFT